MRKYEIGFIINPEITDEEVKKIIDSILQMIKKAGGNVENVDEWGRKKLAFPIQKHQEGFYVFVNAEGEGSVFLNVERKLTLSEKIMRFIILRTDDKLKKANRLSKKWKRIERMTKKSTRSDEKKENVGEDLSEKEEKEDEAK